MSKKLWGELDNNEEKITISSNWRSHLKPNSLPIKTPDYPVSFNSKIKVEKPHIDVSLDPVTLHCIHLEKHNREMIRLLETAKIQIETGRTGFGGEGDVPLILYPAPPIPTEESVTEENPQAKMKSWDANVRGSSLHVRSPCVTLTEQTTWKLLRRSVAAILVLTGYESTTPHVLDTLTDVAHDFLTRVTKLLKYNCNRISLHHTAPPFGGAMEQVLQELGMGDIRDIKDFYKSRVLDRRDMIIKKAQALHEQYENLRNSEGGSALSDALSPRDSDSIPELKFPDIDDVQGTPLPMEATLQFEDGLQVLHSFEQAQTKSDLDSIYFE